MINEAGLWAKQKVAAEAALTFAIDFIGCRMGANDDQVLDTSAKGRLTGIVRAVSIVESRHGTAGVNEPVRDPLQCGNPADSWWKELTGQSGNGSRFIRGPGLLNLWAKELPKAAESAPGFPATARLELLADATDGHDDDGFTPAHSYTWGVIYLIYRINSASDPNKRCFACGDLSRERLLRGATSYNAHLQDYRIRLEQALEEFGGLHGAPAAGEV